MFRRILSSLTVMLFAFCMNAGAQVLQVSESKLDYSAQALSSQAIKTSTLKIQGDEQWVGYWDGKFDNQITSLGAQAPKFYDVAVKYVKGSPITAGKTIEGIRFSFPDHTGVKNLKVWISTFLPKSADEADIICQSVTEVTSMSNASDPYNEVRFNTPCVCPADKDLYIGYSFEQEPAGNKPNSPVLADKDVFKERGALIVRVANKANSGDWVDYFNASKNFGVAAIQLLMKGSFGENMAGFVPTFNTITTMANNVEIPLIMHNLGTNKIENFTIERDINGVKTTQDVKPSVPAEALGAIYRFVAKVDIPSAADRYNITIKITKINGVAVENNYVARGSVIKPSKQGDHKVFVENFTDMNNPESPIGFIGTEKMRNVYKDNIVIATIHVGDILSSPDSVQIYDKLPLIPGANLDRTINDVDPYFGATQGTLFGIGENIDNLKKVAISPADINVKYSINGYILTATSDVTFYYTGDASNYSIAYILTEDGKADPYFKQANGFPKFTELGGLIEQEPLFEPWVNGKEVRDDVVFNDVLIGTQGFRSGVEGSVPASVKEGVANSHSVEFNLRDYPLVKDFSNLRIIAVLINNEDGRVINANSFSPKKEETVPEFEVKEGESWIGYWNGNNPVQPNRLGVNQPDMTYNVAIKYPAGAEEIAGKTIQGIKFALIDIEELREVKVFMTTELPDNIFDADVALQDVNNITMISDPKNPLNLVRFDNPYACPADKDLYIGYSFKVSKTADMSVYAKPVIFDRAIKNSNAFFMSAYNRGARLPWSDYIANTGGCSALIQALVSDTPAGIEEIETSDNAVETARYTMDGTRISEPQKGINIIRYSDGTVRKVVVR